MCMVYLSSMCSCFPSNGCQSYSRSKTDQRTWTSGEWHKQSKLCTYVSSSRHICVQKKSVYLCKWKAFRLRCTYLNIYLVLANKANLFIIFKSFIFFKNAIIEQIIFNVLFHLISQPGTLSEPKTIVLDLEDLDSIPRVAAKALSLFGHIDILINNGGISFRGEAVKTALDVDVQVMKTNYFGQVALTKGWY